MENNLLDAVQQADVRIRNKLSNPRIKGATPLDSGLKWRPLALLIIVNAVGLKTKHNFKQHALRVIVAEAILNATMLPAKKAVNRKRPNGEPKSLPRDIQLPAF